MTRHPRAATPIPDDPADVPETLLSKLNGWKALIGFCSCLLVAGASWAVWQGTLATKADVERVRGAASAEIDLVRRDTLDLSRRLPVVEAAAHDLKADTTIIRAQLFEIAKAVGARQVQPAVIPPVQETNP